MSNKYCVFISGRKLIHSEVPTVVKKSYPAIYNYFPPKEEPVVEKKDDKVAADHLNKKDSILATELKARSTEGISEVIANKEDKKDDSNASTVAEIIVNQKFMTCDENGSVASGDQLQQMTLPPEKKRKRIAPIKIASLGEVVPSSVTSATSVRETAGTIAETKIVADGSETTGSGTIAIEHKVQAGGSPTASAALHLKKILTVTTNNDMGSSATCLSPAKVVELEPARSTPSLFSSATKKRRITPTLISPLKFTTSETGSSNTSSVNDSK